jgi:hypothetical protein
LPETAPVRRPGASQGRAARLTREAWFGSGRWDSAPGPSDDPRPGRVPKGNEDYRIPASIKGTSASIVLGVTTPAPVFTLTPGILYLADITHCVTGMKPCR